MMEDMVNKISRLQRDGKDHQTKPEEPRNGSISRGEKIKRAQNLTKMVLFFVIYSLGYFLFTTIKENPSSRSGLWTAPDDYKLLKKDEPMDKLFGGLLPQGFDEKSCLSRYQALLFHRNQISKHPSSYLISRLRNYEARHKQCGPYTESYNRTLEHLKSGRYNGATTTDCNYVVWIAFNGLGNKMLTIASAFLYALLTNMVLLVDPGEYIPDLFCEPFPEVSWLLPSDFPIIDKFNTFDNSSPYTYGNMLRHNALGNSTGSSFPPYAYLHILHDLTYHDQLFFCDQEQTLLQEVPWLIVKSNNYFIPSLFLMQSFQEELGNLFPEKSAVFHLLGHYLFHPTNSVWELITRYYEAYLARADEIIGIQIRTHFHKYAPDQILACVRKENLLPQMIEFSEEPKTKAVLITSLRSVYFEALRNATGVRIELFQPSHEEHQKTHEDKMHNVKALAEIYLLSFTDKLVTSAWSTFGNVAQSLGGLKPWILTQPENKTVPDPPCRRAVSMEPCFHNPPSHECGSKRGVDAGKIVTHVQHCEDRSFGLKLFDSL